MNRLYGIPEMAAEAAQILEEMRDFFLYMADLTGTLWEHISPTASCNHGFACHAAVSYCRDLLGIRSIDHVYRTVEFRPPEDLPLESVSMEIPVEGDNFIRSGWSRTGGKLVEKLHLPAGWRRVTGPRLPARR